MAQCIACSSPWGDEVSAFCDILAFFVCLELSVSDDADLFLLFVVGVEVVGVVEVEAEDEACVEDPPDTAWMGPNSSLNLFPIPRSNPKPFVKSGLSSRGIFRNAHVASPAAVNGS